MATDYLTIEEFNTHFGNAYTYLKANQARLMISNANMDLLEEIYKTTLPANTPMNWQDTWPTYSDPAIRNNNAEKNIATLRKAAEKQMSVIYNDIPASIWTDADRNTLRRKTGAPRETTSHDESISLSCIGVIKKLGGGEIDFGCRTTSDASKASVPVDEGADGVLISYSILPQGTATEQLPAGPEDCEKQKAFSGATFRLKLGASQEGKVVHYFLQWNDSKHPERNGPSGGRQSTLIA
jgi:hypothetical protein